MLKKAEKAFEKAIDILGSVLFALMLASTTFNIVSYWLTRKRFAQFDEIVLTLFLWVTFIALGVLYRTDEHICVTFLIDSAKPAVKKWMQLINHLFVLVTSVVFVYYSYKLVMRSFNKYTSILKLPYAYIDIGVLVGYLSLSFVSAIRLFEHIKQMVSRRKEG